MAGASSYLFLMCGRKMWHFDDALTEGWECVADERFDFVECSIWRKPAEALTPQDRKSLEEYGEAPDGWIEPGRVAEREA